MGLFSRKANNRTDLPELQTVVNAFGQCLETRSSVLCDIRALPYPKETIKLALTRAIQLTTDGTAREQLCVGLITLADFQDMEACKKYGLRPSELMLWEGEAFLKLARSMEAK